MFRFTRSIFTWFNNNLSCLLEFSSCYHTLLVLYWKFLSKTDPTNDEPLKKNETWNELPDVAIKKIFEKLKVVDRTRLKVVSKSWNQILNRVDIPTALGAPWLIVPSDTYSNPKTFLTQITLKSCSPGNQRSYNFKLPKFYEDDDALVGGCLCGSSNGWLVIAAAGGPNLKPDMFLWNPLSGTTRKLPPLSTVPFVAVLRPKLDDLPSFIKRVEVFRQDKHCIVVVVFSDPAGDKEDCLALCTPQEKRWSIMKGDSYYSYSDILHHKGRLYALAQINNDEDEKEEEEKIRKANQSIHLSSRSKYCEVRVCVLRLKYKLNARRWTRYNEDDGFISRCFNITYANEFTEHLVECSITGKLLVVAAIFDSHTYNSNGEGPGEPFMCDKTSAFEVRMVETLERVRSIGQQCLFIASTRSCAIPSSAEGIDPDYIYFSTQDSRGLIEDQDQRIVARERGSFDIQQNILLTTGMDYLLFPVQFKSGWFNPQLF